MAVEKTLSEHAADIEQQRKDIVRRLLADGTSKSSAEANAIANAALYALACSGWTVERNKGSG